MDKRMIGLVVGFAIIGLIFAFIGFANFNKKVQPDNTDVVSVGGSLNVDEENGPMGTGPEIFTVEITSSGFSPNTLTIKKGDSVTWINKGKDLSWPASAMHPTHAVYPESGGCIGSKFDACKGLAEGEIFTFIFNEIGTWKYHDHLQISNTGTIVVD